MATIWDDKNHSSGESFILTPSASKDVKEGFGKIKFPVMKISEKEFKDSKKKEIIKIPFNLVESKRDIVFYFRDDKTSYKLISPIVKNSHFKWVTAGTTTDRNKMTEIKELCSLYMINKKINENKFYKDHFELMDEVSNDVKDIKDYWRTVYFTSALEHAKALDKLNLRGSYDIERQQKGFSKLIYSISKKISGKAPDNWNPSDIWLKKKSYNLKEIKDFEKEIKDSHLDNKELSLKFKMILDDLFNKQELIGISLKQIDKGNAKLDLISYDTVKSKIKDMDFSKIECYMREAKNGLPAYGELRTKSGFNIKWGGRANASMANINLEGQMSKSTHQMGSIDSKVISSMASDSGFKILKDSDFKDTDVGIKDLFNKLDDALKITKNKQPKIYNMYFKDFSNEKILNEYGFIEVKRFIAQVSVFEFVDSLSTDNILDFYILAKKVDKINPIYYILH